MAHVKKPRKKLCRNDLTAEHVRSAMTYDPETGDLHWKYRPDRPSWWNGKMPGKKVGVAIDRHGHGRVMIDQAVYGAHRIIWLIMTGEWPINDIDHINGVRNDNRWINLRAATRAQNLWNMRVKDSNKSGFKGVSWHKDGNAWVAQIRVPGTNRYLGLFKTPEEAAEAYRKAAIELRGEFARLE